MSRSLLLSPYDIIQLFSSISRGIDLVLWCPIHISSRDSPTSFMEPYTAPVAGYPRASESCGDLHAKIQSLLREPQKLSDGKGIMFGSQDDK